MDNLATLLENRNRTKITFRNWQDPSDGTLSISATVYCKHTGQPLVDTGWHYTLADCIAELDEKCSKLDAREKQ